MNKSKKVVPIVVVIVGVFALVLTIAYLVIAQPTLKKSESSEMTVSAEKLEAHVRKLSIDFHPRNYRETANQKKTAQYILDHFKRAGAEARFQGFQIPNGSYRNVIGVFNKGAGNKLILGAHYDSCDDTPGADDNASGVAGLIELAYLLGEKAPNCEVELVAYNLEEPPYFGSQMMGSYHHALQVDTNKEDVQGVIILEMIGYFSDEEGSQDYPSPILHSVYPSEGNFIAVVSKFGQQSYTKKIKGLLKGRTPLPVYSLNAPEILPGVDFSDHRNYWPFGFDAIMVTDTAFYRNKNYHTLNDTVETLDYGKMAHVVTAVYEAVLELGKGK